MNQVYQPGEYSGMNLTAILASLFGHKVFAAEFAIAVLICLMVGFLDFLGAGFLTNRAGKSLYAILSAARIFCNRSAVPFVPCGLCLAAL